MNRFGLDEEKEITENDIEDELDDYINDDFSDVDFEDLGE